MLESTPGNESGASVSQKSTGVDFSQSEDDRLHPVFSLVLSIHDSVRPVAGGQTTEAEEHFMIARKRQQAITSLEIWRSADRVLRIY